MVEKRKLALANLVAFSASIAELKQELAELEWDYEGPSFALEASDVVAVLKRYINNELDAQNVEDWANLIEMRDDIMFKGNHASFLENAIFELANPVLHGELIDQSARSLVAQLTSS